MSDIDKAISIMEELEDDETVSTNVKEKISDLREELENTDDDEKRLAINKVLSELEEISNDVNVPAFVRTQIWHITSTLEAS